MLILVLEKLKWFR